MDMRTGKTYETKDEALAAGVPESDIAEIDGEEVRFSSGPFKNRVYQRVNGQLRRVSIKMGDVTKTNSRGELVRAK